MRNYQTLYYQHFFTLTPDGIETEVSKRECFAPAVEPSPDCPYVQRWWYDCEAGYAIRLPRDAYGEDLGNRNAADRKKQERVKANTVKYTAIELDKRIGYSEDGTAIYTELEDKCTDTDAIYEESARFDLLKDFLGTLTEDDRVLWEMMKVKARKQQIADHFHITLDGVRYRENRLKDMVRSNPELKRFYTDI
jgi:hypothetical protein